MDTLSVAFLVLGIAIGALFGWALCLTKYFHEIYLGEIELDKRSKE